MSEVKRYDHDCYEYEAGSYMTERLDGDYVLHSDYEKLKAQLERAESVIEEQSSIIQEIARKFEQNKFKKLCLTSNVKNRFFKFIKISESCHEWIGSLSAQGYGQISINNKPYLAHRVSCAIHKMQFFDFHVVDHICRNRKCVNPEHLRIVGTRLNSIENSTSQAAHNSTKTHCKNGHPLSGDNLIIKSANSGLKFFRLCKTCRDLWNKKSKANIKAREYFKEKEQV